MPRHTSSTDPLRLGVHDLRNVLNAVQINAYAARKLLDDPSRTLACIDRIEAACTLGNDVLQQFPVAETLGSAASALDDRLREADMPAQMHIVGDPHTPVPGLLRQALCLVGVECAAMGAHRFSLAAHHGDFIVLRCDAGGMRAPGPVAAAIARCGLAEVRLDLAPLTDGWALRWTLPSAT